MSFYIVYSYTPSFSSTAPKKYIMGIYKELNHAINRQYEVCGKNHVTGVNNSVHGNGKITFINVIGVTGRFSFTLNYANFTYVNITVYNLKYLN